MLKASLKNPALRRRARQFGHLLRHSAVTPRTGRSYKPRLVSNGELGLTFIGHASFFVQMGRQNVVIDPNFARWLFVLKRLRQPGVQVGDLPPIDLVLVTHAHFDHLHRPSLRAIVQQTVRRRGISPTIVVPHHVFDLVSDLGLWALPVAVVGGAIRVGTPFLYVSLGECLTEKSGRVNLGLEGTLVMGAMAAYGVSYLTNSPWLGVLAAGGCGVAPRRAVACRLRFA